MLKQPTAKYHLLRQVLQGMMFLCVAQTGLCDAQAPRVGTLHLDGQGIKLLVVQDDAGHEKIFEQPETDVTLPEGKYRVERVVLLGGRSCRPDEFPADRWFAIEPNAPATLKLGVPLRQAIAVTRRGSVLDLTYELIGQGGEHYEVSRDPNRPGPAFAVYRGDHTVASGDFEFG
jgi:hypothetical protein